VITNSGMPSMVDTRPFSVGQNLACTPGAVVYREEMFELLQYAPSTPTVRQRPLVMVPPQLNRHYVLDLAPGRSLVEYTVSHGIQTFMVVWRAPQREHGHWGLDEYLAAMLRALDVVRSITGAKDVSWFGLCAGGATSALLLGHLAAKGQTPIHSATFLVTMLDSRCPNMVGTLTTSRVREIVAKDAAAGKVYSAKAVARNFAWMRPNDLVYSYVVNDWLLGDDPPAFDILAWNDDATGITAALERDSLEVLATDKATRPGAITVLGTPIDLSKVDIDSFHIAGQKDHITTWRACYLTSQILGGTKEAVIADTGHIQTFVNPPGKSRYHYWTAPATEADPDAWLTKATKRDGSWWPQWVEWLLARSGEDKPAPTSAGNAEYPPGDAAPGRYVHQK
jgi:polyhydroxyalkanoate synthase subunit PhaC